MSPHSIPSCRWATLRCVCERWPRCSTAPSARACPPSSPAGTTVWTLWKAAWPTRLTWIQSGTSTSVRLPFLLFYLLLLLFTSLEKYFCNPFSGLSSDAFHFNVCVLYLQVVWFCTLNASIVWYPAKNSNFAWKAGKLPLLFKFRSFFFLNSTETSVRKLNCDCF